MNINISDALDLAEYARESALELLEYAESDIRLISADQLESAAFTNNPLFAQTDDFFPMILTYELICAYITNITNRPYSDICADY
jgi:hypothetical protein